MHVRLFINKIFLYDDKLIITFTTGDEEVTIEDKLFDKIESDFSGDNFCISNVVGHHKTANQNWFAVFCLNGQKAGGLFPTGPLPCLKTRYRTLCNGFL